MWRRWCSGCRRARPLGLAAVCAGGRRSFCLLFVAPTDLRPPRGLPARSPSAPRASLGVSSRSPARPRRPCGGLQSGEACGCEWPGLARPPARLGGLTSFGAAPRSPPVPSGPSGALHTSGAWVADRRLYASTRCLAWPRRPRGALQSVGVSVCCPARPCRRPPAPCPGPLHPAGLASSGHFPHS